MCIHCSFGQPIKKYAISNTGCAAYFYCNPGTFELSYSDDSSKVYTAECENAEVSYGVIGVELKEPNNNMAASEDLLISYLDYLKTAFKITSSAGYGKGHRLKNREDTRGVIDYWTDEEKNNWKIKGWTDGKFIAVMYAYSKKELPDSRVNLFLDGFRLPGMQ
jgi:hypothetical protein